MKILIAPDKFRGTFDAPRAAACMAEGIRRELPRSRIHVLPAADGGEGTLEILVARLGARIESTVVPGPLGEPVEARWGRTGTGHAILESAQAVGLSRVPAPCRDPLAGGTAGVGRLLRRCLETRCRRITLGLGGTATVDGGAGMARELGYRFLDRRGGLLERIADLDRLDRLDPSGVVAGLGDVPVTGLCDVVIPLLGPGGAAPMFGPQKGAAAGDIPVLERRLEALARVVRRDLGREIGTVPMGGAAGGLGAGVVGFLGGKLVPGTERILDLVGFDDVIDGADLVLTGEGALDRGTAAGKVVHGVWMRARKRSVPVTVICGRAEGEGWEGTRILTPADLPGRQAGSRLTEEDLRELARLAVKI